MNVIVLDLEWNQGNEFREKQKKEIPFEIIEIGAVKITGFEDCCRQDQEDGFEVFHELICPQIYREMHHMTRKILHLDISDLKDGRCFPEVMNSFLTWCKTDKNGKETSCMFATWGPQDLTELQRNMRYYQMPLLGQGPLQFYDVQKLFSIAFEDKKSRRNLEYAVDFLKIDKGEDFHRALSDAYYTAKVLEKIKDPAVLQKVSFDSFQLPRTRKEEIHIVFDDYAKYISRVFEDKGLLMADREVVSTKCYYCHCNLKRKMKWFTPNGKHYYSVSHCPVHGYMKGKIRVRKAENEGVYAVKTLKFISEEDALDLRQKKEKAEELKKMKTKKTKKEKV